MSTGGGSRNLVDEATYQTLPSSCKLLVDLINMMPSDSDTLVVPIGGLFPESPDTEVFVTATDIADFMTMNWLNTSIVEVFQM